MARSQPFELWKRPEHLARALCQLLAEFQPFERLAVTMTGELCDCFETKRQGVRSILRATAAAAPGTAIQVWTTAGIFAELAAAVEDPLPAAAANWLALATFCGRWAPTGAGLAVDVGSTTTDIVPLWQGQPVPRGRTDRDRLQSRELVYTGVRRTPVCTLLGVEGAAELFATNLDVYLLLGDLVEDVSDCRTADGRPATRPFAHARLARMAGADVESYTLSEARQLAQRICDRQTGWIADALRSVTVRLPEPPRTVVLSGIGEFLARRALIQCPPCAIISFSEQLSPALSEAACAYAVAVLATERAAAGG